MIPPIPQDAITVPVPFSVIVTDKLVTAIGYFAPKLILLAGAVYFSKICYDAYKGIPKQVELLKSIGGFVKNASLVLLATAISLTIIDIAASCLFNVPQIGLAPLVFREYFC